MNSGKMVFSQLMDFLVSLPERLGGSRMWWKPRGGLHYKTPIPVASK